MADILQLLVAGLATGAIYALVAIGFTLLWQTSQTINFAQGEFVMLPAFFVLIAMSYFGLSFWPAVAVGTLVSIIVLGALFKSLVVLAIGIAAVVALQLFLNRTRTGRCMQATAQNPTAARLLGIPVERMILYTFLINGALVALASILITPIYLAKFTNGEWLGLYAFIAAIVGGFNQVRGAIAGGLLLGVVDNFAAAYLSSQYRMALPLLILIVVILFRPQGLLGRIEERTV